MRQMLATLKALNNENRLRILLCLRGGEVCLCQLIEVLELAPSTVSRHVDLLRQAGLVEMRKDGRWHYYRLAEQEAYPAVDEVIRWVSHSLDNDSVITADAARLAHVCNTAAEEWTACYTRN